MSERNQKVELKNEKLHRLCVIASVDVFFFFYIYAPCVTVQTVLCIRGLHWDPAGPNSNLAGAGGMNFGAGGAGG